MKPLQFGGIEAGGTKWVCAVGRGPQDVVDQTSVATTTPADTLRQVIAFFRAQRRPISALGVGAFGPLDLTPRSPSYGHITVTPKPGWSNTDLVGTLERALDVPVSLDTDVNAAALGEHRWGAARDVDHFVYLTVGTGVGGGAMVNGKVLHGLLHPEMGHIRVPHDWTQDPYPGSCPFHGDCLEGLTCGPALAGRWHCDPASLPDDHSAWELEARYLALALVNFICTLSPQRIVLGGGVMQRTGLFVKIRQRVVELLKGYVQSDVFSEQRVERYIVPPDLGGRAGVLGALALAQSGVSDDR